MAELTLDRTVRLLEAAWAEPGAMERKCHMPFGDIPAPAAVSIHFLDIVVHGWDLARATGGDERLDPVVVDAVAAWFDANEAAYRAAGAVGPAVEVPDGADAQDRLLARFGRDPGA